ncbi:2760_t:CDS:2 [Ambispora gerdemannii]|uniref:2760_t:CDS:1 n=1 Tax=Ambispora gerdemannii TaxID=144530 RepID=A0A9N9G9D0_9GLOM|nr:2760_t:CDS:2 [Ambispora gerdemannii]
MRKRAVRILAIKHEKVANQRKDLAHKLSRELVKKYDLIAHEKLQVKNMVKNKLAETGKRVVEVEARNTSQICSNCGELKEPKLKLSQRVFKCSNGDYKDNRDVNAARNILKRAELRINGSDFDKSRQELGTSLPGAVSLEAL